jgi:DNA-binding response OmpR family regulator
MAVLCAGAVPTPSPPATRPRLGAPATPATVLLIGDDVLLAATLRDRLASRRHTVWHADDGTDTEAIGDAIRPDVVFVDVPSLDTSGLWLVARLRERWTVPLIVCTAATRPEDAALALQLGADGVVRRPVDIEELVARLEAALRRRSPQAGAPATAGAPQLLGHLALDRARGTVALGGALIHLTPIEYRLLCSLADPPDHVHTVQALARRVWGSYDPGIGRSLQVHLRRLRVKLDTSAVRPPALVAIRGLGYRLVWDGAASAVGPRDHAAARIRRLMADLSPEDRAGVLADLLAELPGEDRLLPLVPVTEKVHEMPTRPPPSCSALPARPIRAKRHFVPRAQSLDSSQARGEGI